MDVCSCGSNDDGYRSGHFHVISHVYISSTSPFHAKPTTKGLANLSKAHVESDSTFLLADPRYHCPWFIAEFLSPKVCSLRSADPTLTEMHIKTTDPNELFREFLSLGMGGECLVPASHRHFFASLVRELHNLELYCFIVDHYDGGPIITNVVERLEFDMILNMVIFHHSLR
jgi:hypothetical protein